MMTENSEMESDSQLQRSPNNMPIQPMTSKLQRLKRSLSFKTMMRSKSVENFFQRSYSDARLPADFITDPPPPSPPLPPGSPLVGERSPSISPSLSPNPSICSHSPSLSLSPSLPAKPPRAQINHCFQDHIFRKPTNCQHCKHMIVGKVQKLFPQDYTIPCRYIWHRLMIIWGRGCRNVCSTVHFEVKMNIEKRNWSFCFVYSGQWHHKR
ncbi:SH3 and cysteine-rich domain-containing protein 2-like [Poecilia formosa]|uniref:SH3 and cysteine-rich domain-containing protein 2-like n=1 Tax=Poecilia formosa TaxID=48698 RepID=UPI0007B99FBF|nr:PREDICTED: SH3 and cysteine-rich domain-containing protein 2-like [Poecilia formosa]